MILRVLFLGNSLPAVDLGPDARSVLQAVEAAVQNAGAR